MHCYDYRHALHDIARILHSVLFLKIEFKRKITLGAHINHATVKTGAYWKQRYCGAYVIHLQQLL